MAPDVAYDRHKLSRYYRTLGVRRDATQEEIKAAFRKAALLAHPDTSSGGEAETFRRVHAAYGVLRDEAKRRRYDQGVPV